jgi:dTDP-6-deoxy-L-talose 4-dehydrogenase (NAD+)
MKIAVTGASGFIGGYVLAELIRAHADVYAATRDTARLSAWADSLHAVKLDIAEADTAQYDQLGRPDVLIHLAWDGLPNYKSLHHFEYELPRQYRFLKTMIEAGLPALVVTGTCYEYGAQSGPLSESLPALPNNPYGYAKDSLRRQLEFLRTLHAFDLTWARLFYMYGGGQSKGALYSMLKEAAEQGKSTFDMSGGEQLRDYLPVEVVAQHLVSLSKLRKSVGLVNVCSGRPISIRTLVERWIRENAWDITLNLGHFPYPDYEPMAFWGDDRRLNALIRP